MGAQKAISQSLVSFSGPGNFIATLQTSTNQIQYITTSATTAATLFNTFRVTREILISCDPLTAGHRGRKLKQINSEDGRSFVVVDGIAMSSGCALTSSARRSDEVLIAAVGERNGSATRYTTTNVAGTGRGEFRKIHFFLSWSHISALAFNKKV